MIEADKLGQLRTGAASGVAARFLARPGATTLGVLGCGWQAESQVQCIREAVPTIEHVVVYCRTEERLEEFCKRMGAEAGETHRDAGGQDVVVTATTSRDPVLPRRVASGRRARLRDRGERPALPRAGQRRPRAGRLRLLRLAAAVAARVGRPDRARGAGHPRLARGARAAGGRRRRAPGTPVGRRHRALQVERPRSLGRRDRSTRPRARASEASGGSSRPRSWRARRRRGRASARPRAGRAALALALGRAVSDVRVVEDVGERAAALVLANHVLRDAVFARRAGAEKGERVSQEVAKRHAGDSR